MLSDIRRGLSAFVRRPVGRLLFFGAGIVLAYFLFPGLRRHALNLSFALDSAECVEQLQVSLLRKGELEHSLRGRIRNGRLDWDRRLLPGSYTVKPVLHCEDGRRASLESRELVVEGDDNLTIHLRGRCECAP